MPSFFTIKFIIIVGGDAPYEIVLNYFLLSAQKTRQSEDCLDSGAGGVTRTRDLRITNALLYQLSYTSTYCTIIIDSF